MGRPSKKRSQENKMLSDYNNVLSMIDSAPAYDSMLDSESYLKTKNLANNEGLNPWSSMALSRQNKMAQNNIEEATQRVAGQNATSLSKLAAGGGLSSGARERQTQAGQSDLLNMVQDINSAKDTNALQIGISDADSKQKALSEAGAIERADNQAMNAYNQDKARQKLEAYASYQQAKATSKSGKK